MIPLLLSILFAPLVILFALWFSVRLVATPWQTTAEALVWLLYWLALRLQAAAEACDSGLNCYRDAILRPVKPNCEQMRELRETTEREHRETQEHIDRTKREVLSATAPWGVPGISANEITTNLGRMFGRSHE